MRVIGSSVGFGWEDRGRWQTLLLYSPFSFLSVFSVLALFGFGSIASVASVGSIASVGSVGSVVSVGCVHGFFEICGPLRPKESSFDRHLEKHTGPVAHSEYARVVYPVAAAVFLIALVIDHACFGKRQFYKKKTKALMMNMLT